MLSAAELQELEQLLPTLPKSRQDKALQLIAEYKSRITQVTAQTSFLDFIKHVYPGYKVGPHHIKLAQIIEDVAAGKTKRITVSIAPRHGKSEMISYLAPAWFLGRFPEKKIIMASHTADLAVSFGRRVRNLVGSEAYREIFPGVELQADSKSASRWGTNHGGDYFACGIGAALAGRGADLLLIDDPHALPLDTEVPTPEGFKTVAQLQVGDHVYGPDGVPTRVMGKSEVRRDRELYEVVTDDGERVLCDGGHLWTYDSETCLKLMHLKKTATTRELAAWSKSNRPYLPRHAAVLYPEAALPIDPYVLGAWLGDGTASLGRMTSHPDDAGFMREQFEAAGYKTTTLKDLYSFGVLGLRAQLVEAGLLGSKHIPEAYLVASYAQRLALLQGLMDTDGSVTASGQCSFSNTNRGLAEGVRQLLHSMGFKARMCTYFDARARYRTRQIDYRVNFRMAACCRMPRKACRVRTSEDKRRRSIEVCKTELRGDVQCITVARDDGLFLVGRGYVVTHNSEQEAMQGRPEVFDSAWEWFQSGPLQRLMPGGAVAIVATRWSKSDLIGRAIEHMVHNPTSDQWEVVEFPAILPNNTPLWPDFWSLEELQNKRAGMDPRYWSACYMQTPTSEEAALIKREWWQEWEKDNPPDCSFTIMTLDAAQEANSRADFNALQVWGVFRIREDGPYNIILLNAIKERLEFPELKKLVLEQYREWEPDSFIVEKKSNGAALYQEMRRMGIPVGEFTPGKGQDKISRVNAVADIFSSGMVWYPPRRWALDVVEEVADFPSGRNDDQVDAMTLALARFRQGGFLQLPIDEEEPRQTFKSQRVVGYY